MSKTLMCLLAVAAAGGGYFAGEVREPETPQEKKTEARDWEFHDADALARRRASSGRPYLPFLDRAALSCGWYGLAAGARDGQSPHKLDEIYYIKSGQASFSVGKGEAREDKKVGPGSVIYVKAGVPHRFKDITEDLEILVLFSKQGG